MQYINHCAGKISLSKASLAHFFHCFNALIAFRPSPVSAVIKNKVLTHGAAYLCLFSECNQSTTEQQQQQQQQQLQTGPRPEGWRKVCVHVCACVSVCCCCDWTRVRGNATHAWTHRPAHSCVKNTLLFFRGHGSGKDPESVGQGGMGSHTPLCAGPNRDLGKLIGASCLHEKIASWCRAAFPFQTKPPLIGRMVDLAEHAQPDAFCPKTPPKHTYIIYLKSNKENRKSTSFRLGPST